MLANVVSSLSAFTLNRQQSGGLSFIDSFDSKRPYCSIDFCYAAGKSQVVGDGFISRGNESKQEDFIYTTLKGDKLNILLLDCVSGFHLGPENNIPISWSGRKFTTGQVAGLTCIEALEKADASATPRQILSRAYAALNRTWKTQGLNTSDPNVVTYLAGAAGVFAVVDLLTLKAKVLSWGDVTAALQIGPDIFCTRNQCLQHELHLIPGADQVRAENGGRFDWKVYGDRYFNPARTERVNNITHPERYGLLNGQDNVQGRNFLECVDERDFQLVPGSKYCAHTDGRFSVEDYRNQAAFAEARIAEMDEYQTAARCYAKYRDPGYREKHHEAGGIFLRVV